MKITHRIKLPEIVLIVLLLISSITLGVSSGSFIVNLNSVGFTVVSSMQKGIHLVVSSVTGFFTAIHDVRTLQQDYNALTERLKDYEYLQRNNADIRKENERLREQLQFAEEQQYRNIPAQIIGRDTDRLYSGITINKGSINGVRKGMPVIAIQDGNVGVVGKIVKVGLGTSMIMPIYDVKCNISARMQNSRELGIVSGNGSVDIPLSMSYIRKRSLGDLHIGDIVVTSGENGNYLRDIPVGTIYQMRELEYDTSLDIDLKLIIDFSRLENVLIVDQTALNNRGQK